MLPLIAPAIFAGALFAFTLSLDEFIITLFLIGGHNTLPIYIYTQVKFGITPEVNALATLLLAASLVPDRARVRAARLVRRARRLVPRRARLGVDRDPAAVARARDARRRRTPRWPSRNVGNGACACRRSRGTRRTGSRNASP